MTTNLFEAGSPCLCFGNGVL